MTTKSSVVKQLWTFAVLLGTYLILGSFVVSKNIIDLIYLIILYSFIIFVPIISKKEN